jgi:hypothetical protein
MKTKQGQVSVQHQSLRSFFAGGSTPAKSLMQKTHTQTLVVQSSLWLLSQIPKPTRKYADETEK